MKVTIDELSEGVLTACVGGKTTLDLDLHLIRGGLLKQIDEDVALGELFMMRISVAAYALQTFFNADVREQTRDAFGRRLHAILLSSGEKRIRTEPNKVIDEMNKRYDLYMEAIQTPHHLGPPWNVGKVFARLCGRELDADVVMVGSIGFGGAIVAVTEFLRKCKAMEGGEVIILPAD
jgi:hypothetical protein